MKKETENTEELREKIEREISEWVINTGNIYAYAQSVNKFVTPEVRRQATEKLCKFILDLLHQERERWEEEKSLQNL